MWASSLPITKIDSFLNNMGRMCIVLKKHSLYWPKMTQALVSHSLPDHFTFQDKIQSSEETQKQDLEVRTKKKVLRHVLINWICSHAESKSSLVAKSNFANTLKKTPKTTLAPASFMRVNATFILARKSFSRAKCRGSAPKSRALVPSRHVASCRTASQRLAEAAAAATGGPETPNATRRGASGGASTTRDTAPHPGARSRELCRHPKRWLRPRGARAA
jgi:hypothetical protein